MAYQTYTTEALVCGSSDSNTSDRSYLLFTKEAGMLWATAKSVREERSKQRYALQDFSLIRVSLVKGKSGWRIGSVESHSNPFLAATDRRQRAFVKNIVSLIRRYIHGEQPIVTVFNDTEEALQLSTSAGDLDALYVLFSARLLHELGYISQQSTVAALFSSPSLALASTQFVPSQAAALTHVIEQAHRQSHL